MSASARFSFFSLSPIRQKEPSKILKNFAVFRKAKLLSNFSNSYGRTQNSLVQRSLHLDLAPSSNETGEEIHGLPLFGTDFSDFVTVFASETEQNLTSHRSWSQGISQKAFQKRSQSPRNLHTQTTTAVSSELAPVFRLGLSTAELNKAEIKSSQQESKSNFPLIFVENLKEEVTSNGSKKNKERTDDAFTVDIAASLLERHMAVSLKFPNGFQTLNKELDFKRLRKKSVARAEILGAIAAIEILTTRKNSKNLLKSSALKARKQPSNNSGSSELRVVNLRTKSELLWSFQADIQSKSKWKTKKAYLEYLPDLKKLESLCSASSESLKINFRNSWNTATADVNVEKLKASEKPCEVLEVYVDGACKNNGLENAKMSIGIWFGREHPWNISRLLKRYKKNTNQRAELISAIEGIEAAVSKRTVFKGQNLTLKVITDSAYVVDGMTKYLPNWKTKKWQNVENVTDFKKLDQIIRKAGAVGFKVEFVKVPGHADCAGNKEADKLAKLALKEKQASKTGQKGSTKKVAAKKVANT